MKKVNIEFLDEYKKLDKLCSEMLETKTGVSDYIKKMDEFSEQGKAAVDSWTEDYKSLKHLRWLRNKIAHETDCPDCTKEDKEALKAFITKIEKKSDPLSSYYSVRKRIKRSAGLSPALLFSIVAALILLFCIVGFFSK